MDGRVAAPRAYLSLTVKGVLVVAIPVCALLAAMVVFYQFQQRMRDAGASVEHTYQVRVEMRRVFIRMVNAETGIRGYLLTRRAAFLEPYLTARKELPERLEDLRTAHQRQSRAGRAGVPRAGAESPGYSRPWKPYARPPLPDGMPPICRSSKAASPDMDELRAVLTAMEDEEDRLLMERSAAQERAQRRLRAAVFVGGLLGLLGGIGAAVLFTTKIARRVRRLEKDARRWPRASRFSPRSAGMTRSRGWGAR